MIQSVSQQSIKQNNKNINFKTERQKWKKKATKIGWKIGNKQQNGKI